MGSAQSTTPNVTPEGNSATPAPVPTISTVSGSPVAAETTRENGTAAAVAVRNFVLGREPNVSFASADAPPLPTLRPQEINPDAATAEDPPMVPPPPPPPPVAASGSEPFWMAAYRRLESSRDRQEEQRPTGDHWFDSYQARQEEELLLREVERRGQAAEKERRRQQMLENPSAYFADESRRQAEERAAKWERQRIQRAEEHQVQLRRQQEQTERTRLQAAERIRVERAAQAEQTRKRAELERQRAKLERQRAEEKRAQAVVEGLINAIDYYIRTRKRFDCADPTTYRCGLSSIQQDTHVVEALEELLTVPDYNDTTLIEFIQDICDEFAVHEDAKNSSNLLVSVTRLTPGLSDRMFGYYECSSCRREWMSSWSWTDKFQMCNGCDLECYAYCREELRGGGASDKKPHDHSRCEKCREVGDCTRPGHNY
jgi:hypothetical protein